MCNRLAVALVWASAAPRPLAGRGSISQAMARARAEGARAKKNLRNQPTAK